MLSLVGPQTSTEYALPLATPELQARLDSLYDTGQLSELVNPHAQLAALRADFATPPDTEWPRPRLGVLYWPVVGLARYAFATYVVDEYTLGQLRAQMTATGSSAVKVRFRDDVDVPAPPAAPETPRDVQMYFLASRPLVRNGSGALTTEDTTDPVDAWVVLLVDSRYAYLTQSVSLSGTSSWASLLTANSVTPPTINAAYLTPGPRWTASAAVGRSIAWLMDCAAQSCGTRIVTVPGATPVAQLPGATGRAVLSAAHAAAVADPAGSRFVGGGPLDAADTNEGLPNTARVAFGDPSETTPVFSDATIQTTYTPATLAILTHWADPPAVIAIGVRATLATQFAADWLSWQSGLYDTVYEGFVAAPASAYCWAVEWAHTSKVGTTRFVRPPHWYGYLLAPQLGGASGGTPGADGKPGRTIVIVPEDGETPVVPPGRRGKPGIQGPKGRRGTPIPLSGDDGEQGPIVKGRTGNTGPRGGRGPRGHTIVGQEGEDGQSAPFVRGPRGRDGIDGASRNRYIVLPNDDQDDGRPPVRPGGKRPGPGVTFTYQPTTKGDLWGFNTGQARIPIGADTFVLTADSTQALGLKWAAPGGYTPPVTTKGDLFGFSTVPTRVPVGTNGLFLTADSTQATGLNWASPFPGAVGFTAVFASGFTGISGPTLAAYVKFGSVYHFSVSTTVTSGSTSSGFGQITGFPTGVAGPFSCGFNYYNNGTGLVTSLGNGQFSGNVINAPAWTTPGVGVGVLTVSGFFF